VCVHMCVFVHLCVHIDLYTSMCVSEWVGGSVASFLCLVCACVYVHMYIVIAPFVPHRKTTMLLTNTSCPRDHST